MRFLKTLIFPALFAGTLIGCASIIREETELVAGAYRVKVSKTLLTADKRMGPSSRSRDIILTKGTQVQLVAGEGSIALVRLEDGQEGYVFHRDLESVSVPSPSELRENLRDSNHTPSADEPEEPPVKKSPPVDRSLIEEANDLEMPTIKPLLVAPIAE